MSKSEERIQSYVYMENVFIVSELEIEISKDTEDTARKVNDEFLVIEECLTMLG